MAKKKYTALEVASALRMAGEWLVAPRKVRIRGRFLKRTGGSVLGKANRNNEPSGVCLLGAAWYALDPSIADNTSEAVQVLSMGRAKVGRHLEEAWGYFDEAVEHEGGRTSSGREAIKNALAAINAAALEIERSIATTKEREVAAVEEWQKEELRA